MAVSWTEERIEQLRALWDEGKSASQIAAALGEGVSRNAVIGKAHRLGLKARPSPVKSDSPKSAPKKATKAKAEKKKVVTLLDLTERICKWPIGHPGDPDFHFCGKPVHPGMPYCTAHCAQAYQAQQPRRDRNRDRNRALIR